MALCEFRDDGEAFASSMTSPQNSKNCQEHHEVVEIRPGLHCFDPRVKS